MDHIFLVLLGAFCGGILGFFACALMSMSKCGDCKAQALAEKERIQRLWF